MSAVQMDTEDSQNVAKLSDSIMVLYGGLERMKHFDALCVHLARICLSIRKTILVSTVPSSQIHRAAAEIEGLWGHVKIWEGKSLAWWYLFRADVKARLTSAIKSLTDLRLNLKNREFFPVFPARRLYPYMYDGKFPYETVDYAAFDFDTTFSGDIKNNRQSDLPAILTEMDTVAKAINLRAELVHLLLYYDEIYKDGYMKDYTAWLMLPLAIRIWNDQNSEDEKAAKSHRTLFSTMPEIPYMSENKIKERTSKITLAEKKLADRADFPKTHGDIKFLKERWADRKAYLIDTISELRVLDVEGKLARLRDSLQFAKIDTDRQSRQLALDSLLQSTSINIQGQGSYLTIPILERPDRDIVEGAIGFLTSQLQRIGYGPRGTQKNPSKRNVVSAKEKSNLCPNLVGMQHRTERATTSDTVTCKQIIELKYDLRRCQRELERATERAADLADAEDNSRQKLELYRTKAQFHLYFTKWIGIFLSIQTMEKGSDNGIEDEEYKEPPILMRLKKTDEVIRSLIRKLDNIWGKKNRVHFMNEILDHSLPVEVSDILDMSTSPFIRMCQITRQSIPFWP